MRQRAHVAACRRPATAGRCLHVLYGCEGCTAIPYCNIPCPVVEFVLLHFSQAVDQDLQPRIDFLNSPAAPRGIVYNINLYIHILIASAWGKSNIQSTTFCNAAITAAVARQSALLVVRQQD